VEKDLPNGMENTYIVLPDQVLGCHLASCIAQLERRYRLLIIVTFVGGPLSTACNLVNDRWNQVP